jgi:hypothetical protein
MIYGLIIPLITLMSNNTISGEKSMGIIDPDEYLWVRFLTGVKIGSVSLANI